MVYVASSRPSKQGYYIVRPSLQKQNRGEGRRETGDGRGREGTNGGSRLMGQREKARGLEEHMWGYGETGISLEDS